MPQSLSQVYVHIVFSTKNREPFIDEEIEERFFSYLGKACKEHGCNPIRVGGYEDHVHILCTLSRTITQAELLETIKKQSSKWMKQQARKYSEFYWQRGYGIFSVSPKKVDAVTNYITNQRTHHQNQTFKEEFRAILKNAGMNWDEKYVWD
ncbi:MAG: IS200/IS605 family transposase [Bacteroidota bacterium]